MISLYDAITLHALFEDLWRMESSEVTERSVGLLRLNLTMESPYRLPLCMSDLEEDEMDELSDLALYHLVGQEV